MTRDERRYATAAADHGREAKRAIMRAHHPAHALRYGYDAEAWGDVAYQRAREAFRYAAWSIEARRPYVERRPRGPICGALSYVDRDTSYKCTRPADHAGDHQMTTHPMLPTWKDGRL